MIFLQKVRLGFSVKKEVCDLHFKTSTNSTAHHALVSQCWSTELTDRQTDGQNWSRPSVRCATHGWVEIPHSTNLELVSGATNGHCPWPLWQQLWNLTDWMDVAIENHLFGYASSHWQTFGSSASCFLNKKSIFSQQDGFDLPRLKLSSVLQIRNGLMSSSDPTEWGDAFFGWVLNKVCWLFEKSGKSECTTCKFVHVSICFINATFIMPIVGVGLNQPSANKHCQQTLFKWKKKKKSLSHATLCSTLPLGRPLPRRLPALFFVLWKLLALVLHLKNMWSALLFSP